MPLTTTSQIRQIGHLPSDLADEKVNPHLADAESELRSLITDSIYESIEAETATDDQDDKSKLARAEAMLALTYLLPSLNIRANSEQGGIVSSVGFAESKNSLLSQAELDNLIKKFHDRAMRIIQPYMTTEETDVEFGNSIAFIAV